MGASRAATSCFLWSRRRQRDDGFLLSIERRPPRATSGGVSASLSIFDVDYAAA